MVLRCKGFSEEPQDSALKGVTQEEADVRVNSGNNINPSQKNARKSEGQEATNNKRANQMINFVLIINNCSYANGVERFIKQIDGVESVKGDCDSIRLEVKGKVDPYKIREMVERETKKKVELIFPSDEMKSDRDENKGTEAKMKRIKTRHAQLMCNSLLFLKIKLCCDSCNQKLCKNLKIKGLDIVAMDVDNNLVTVKGTMDTTELSSYIKYELKKDVEISIPTEVMAPMKKGNGATDNKDKHKHELKKDVDISIPTEVMAPIKKGNGATDNKDKHAGTIDKKAKDAAATHKKDKESTTARKKYKGTRTANEKSEGIAGVDEKLKGSANVTEKAPFNEADKYEDGGLKNRKDKDSGGEMKFNASDGVGGNKEDDGSSTIKFNSVMYHRCEDNAYGYWREWHTVKYSNGLHQIFSDENPHSCSIM